LRCGCRGWCRRRAALCRALVAPRLLPLLLLRPRSALRRGTRILWRVLLRALLPVPLPILLPIWPHILALRATLLRRRAAARGSGRLRRGRSRCGRRRTLHRRSGRRRLLRLRSGGWWRSDRRTWLAWYSRWLRRLCRRCGGRCRCRRALLGRGTGRCRWPLRGGRLLFGIGRCLCERHSCGRRGGALCRRWHCGVHWREDESGNDSAGKQKRSERHENPFLGTAPGSPAEV
jgi:hypothetical protein